MVNNAEIFLHCNYDIANFDWLRLKVQSYSNIRLVSQDALPNEYEIPTLRSLKNFCDNDTANSVVLYLHHKGVTRPTDPCVTDWRALMLHFNVENWQQCVDKLTEGYDTVGVNWMSESEYPHYSGNFWWATSEYIKQLPVLSMPRDNDFRSQLNVNSADHRLDSEFWIGGSNPHAYSFHNSTVNHYHNTYPAYMYRNDAKISVVVPTMWKFPQFLDFIADVVQVSAVDEIHIINNDIENTPEHAVLKHAKVKLHNFPQNTFVNPAWNYGVSQSRNNKVCIMNDDVIFDTRLFCKASDFLIGTRVLGLSSGIKEYGQTEISTGLIDFQHFTGQSAHGFGCLMFVSKSHWVDIPVGLNIYYGDNWIFDTTYFRYNQNYLITNMFFYTPYATTTQFLPNRGVPISEIEEPIYRARIEEFKRTITYS